MVGIRVAALIYRSYVMIVSNINVRKRNITRIRDSISPGDWSVVYNDDTIVSNDQAAGTLAGRHLVDADFGGCHPRRLNLVVLLAAEAAAADSDVIGRAGDVERTRTGAPVRLAGDVLAPSEDSRIA